MCSIDVFAPWQCLDVRDPINPTWPYKIMDAGGNTYLTRFSSRIQRRLTVSRMDFKYDAKKNIQIIWPAHPIPLLWCTPPPHEPLVVGKTNTLTTQWWICPHATTTSLPPNSVLTRCILMASNTLPFTDISLPLPIIVNFFFQSENYWRKKYANFTFRIHEKAFTISEYKWSICSKV